MEYSRLEPPEWYQDVGRFFLRANVPSIVSVLLILALITVFWQGVLLCVRHRRRKRVHAAVEGARYSRSSWVDHAIA